MFERFTPEARRVIEVASALATDRGDGDIGTAHLLVALTDPTCGLAALLLADAAIDADVASAMLLPAPGGVGDVQPSLSPQAKKSIELALREALNLAHAHIGSGHLLLGLLRLGDLPVTAVFEAHGVTLEATRVAVRERSEGAKLGGRRRPRRTGRVIEAPTPHERAKAAPPDNVGVVIEEGSLLERALASLGVTPEALRTALADLAAEPDDGPVELDLGAGATLVVAAGARAADLRALLGTAEHITVDEGVDGTLRVEAPPLGDKVWAAIDVWLLP